MHNTLYIPKKLNVGFQKRDDTYTGLLGYVIYWDDKGKLRKEPSWNSWRHKPGDKKNLYIDKKWTTVELGKEVEAQVHDNEPLEGFVLNKEIGGTRHSYGWNARIERVRVLDPRGFEFEISIPNLLFILQEATSSKGKGLEGKFVYSWSGKELVLLPVDSREYKESTKYSKLQSKKITKKDMTEGCIYTFKDKQQCIYLGRHEVHKDGYVKTHNTEYKKQHIFCGVNDTNKYRYENGFTKLATKDSETHVDNYSDLLEDFTNSKYYQKFKNIYGEEFTVTKNMFDDMLQTYNTLFMKEGNSYTRLIAKTYGYEYKDGNWLRTTDTFSIEKTTDTYTIKDNSIEYKFNGYSYHTDKMFYHDGKFKKQYNKSYYSRTKLFDIPYYTIEQTIDILNSIKVYKIYVELENGEKHEMHKY